MLRNALVLRKGRMDACQIVIEPQDVTKHTVMCVNIYNMDPVCQVKRRLLVSQQMGCNLIWAEGGRVTPDSQLLSHTWLQSWWQMIVPLLIHTGEWVRTEWEKVERMHIAPHCLMTHPLFLSLKWFLITPLLPHPTQQSPYSLYNAKENLKFPSVHSRKVSTAHTTVCCLKWKLGWIWLRG